MPNEFEMQAISGPKATSTQKPSFDFIFDLFDDDNE